MEKTKEVANPGLSDPNFTKEKFVKRWVSWSKYLAACAMAVML